MIETPHTPLPCMTFSRNSPLYEMPAFIDHGVRNTHSQIRIGRGKSKCSNIQKSHSSEIMEKRNNMRVKERAHQ